MWKIFDFKCEECGNVFEEMTKEKKATCSCGGQSHIYYTKSTVVGCDSFNPHYDLQLGQHFETKEQKEKYLKDTGRSQTSGHASPRTSNNTSIKCTKKPV